MVALSLTMTMAASVGGVEPSWRIVHSPYPAGDTFVTPFSVVDFGAEGDGRTDDTAAFQEAMNRAAELGGGAVFVPEGRYVIRGRLTVPTGVALRGIWRKPDLVQGGTAGSILMLYAGRGEPDGAPTIGLAHCSGLRELTLWYPEQDPGAIVPYPFTVKQLGGNNATVENVTLVNSYQGIRIGPGSNELHLVRNVVGTPLKTGVWYDSTTDIGRLLTIHFSPAYWSSSGLPGAPAEDGPHADWVRTNGTGLHMGRSDWEYGAFVRVDGYNVGMRITKGARGAPNAQFYGFEFRDCATGVVVADANPYGIVFTRSVFQCRDQALHMEPGFGSVLMLNQCTLDGGELALHEGAGALSLQSCALDPGDIRIDRGSLTVAGCTAAAPPTVSMGRDAQGAALVGNRFGGAPEVVGPGARRALVDDTHVPFREMPAFSGLPERRVKPEREALYVVRRPPGDEDATATIQSALDQAGREGGGTVFLPGGDYRLGGRLTVPSGVELKGVYDVPHHTVGAGSVLHVTGARGRAEGPPTVTLEARAGLTGLSFHYPEQLADDVVPYPFLVAGNGAGIYLLNVNAANAYQFVDFMSRRCDEHVIDYLSGAPLKVGVQIGGGATGGILANTQFNPHYWARTPVGSLYANRTEGGIRSGSGKALWEYQKANLDAMLFGHCVDQVQFENFVFGSLYGIHFVREPGGSAEGGFILGHGTDGSKVSAFFEASGADGLHLVNTELVCMSSRDKEYIICSEDVAGEVVLHSTMLWGQPDRSGTVMGGRLVLQQATFTRHARGFRVRGGELRLSNCHYRSPSRRRDGHVALDGGGAHVVAANSPGPLLVNGRAAASLPQRPNLQLNGNINRRE